MDKPPLRILFLTPYFRPYLGGIERAIEQLSFQLLKDPSVDRIGVLTAKYAFPRVPHPDWADREITPEGIAIFRLDGHPRSAIPFFSVPLVWFSPFQVRRYLKEFNPNVIHWVGDGWFLGHFWTWFWFRRRARIIFTPSFHTLLPQYQWIRPINIFLSWAAKRVVALTRHEVNNVRRTYLVPRSKLEVIGWGAPLPQGPRPEPDSDTLTLLCVGRLGYHKGQSWLFEVYCRAREQFKRPARLVLVGRDEGEENLIRESVRQAGLDEEVLLPGEASDVELENWYARSDLLVLFSRYEAFGLVFFEAMVHGVPVLTHDVGANMELLLKGASVVPKFDKSAAVNEMARLVNDDQYRQHMGREAKEYSMAEFTWPAVAEKYLRIYRSAT